MDLEKIRVIKKKKNLKNQNRRSECRTWGGIQGFEKLTWAK